MSPEPSLDPLRSSLWASWTRVLGEVDRIGRRGRNFGFRLISITQRPAKLNKDVLALHADRPGCHVPQNRDAIKAWVPCPGWVRQALLCLLQMCEEKKRLLLALDQALQALPQNAAGEADDFSIRKVEEVREELDHHVAEHQC